MEQFDILDKHGRLTGLVAEKGARLNDGQYYLGVHAYIHNSSMEFLVQQRSYDKAFLPGGWDIHMGHVVAGEASEEGVIREIQEEIGLNFPPSDLRFVGRVVWEDYHHMVDVYFLEIEYNINALTLQNAEVIGVKAISKAEMLALVGDMDYRPCEYRRMVAGEIDKLITIT